MNTVDEVYTEFQTALNSAVNTHIPTKIITKHCQTPWINRRIRRLHKGKQKAFNTHIIHIIQVSYNKFCKACKMHTKKGQQKVHRTNLFRLGKTILVLHQKPTSRHDWNTNPNQRPPDRMRQQT